MVDAAPGSLPDEEDIEPSWWLDALAGPGGESREYASPEQIAPTLGQLYRAAKDALGSQARQTRVLSALARAAEPLLVPDNWNEPFVPFMTMPDGRRTFLPSDFGEECLTLLAELVPLINAPMLRARVADIAWTYGDRSNTALVQAAVTAYVSAPLTPEVWFDSGRASFRRALELAARVGKIGATERTTIRDQMVGFILNDTDPDVSMFVEISALLREYARPDEPDRRPLAERLVACVNDTGDNFGLARGLLREAAQWFALAKDLDAARASSARVADHYSAEAEARLAADSGAMVAGSLLEKAIEILRTLPREFRAAHGLDERLTRMRARLSEARELTLEEMARITSGPIDISEWVAAARARVTGKPRDLAMAQLFTVAPIIDPEQAMGSEREQMRGSIRRVIGQATFAADGRKVAERSGAEGAEPSDEEVVNEVFHHFRLRTDLTVRALILPSLEVFGFEHRLDFLYLYEICMQSPVVPEGHAAQWARGILHGFNGDMASATAVLVPQLEQLVRLHLKSRGVYTLFVDEKGVESEKSLGALLGMQEASDIFGAGLVLELRGLLTEQVGLNLRNDVAHGMLYDSLSTSAATVYSWWLLSRLAFVPYYNTLLAAHRESPPPADQAESSGFEGSP